MAGTLRPLTRETTMRIRTGLAAGLLAVALAGCGANDDGGDGVASLGGPGSTTTTPGASGGVSGDAGASFAQCMRDRGVDMPDPDGDGGRGVRVRIPEGADKSKIDAAMAECKQFLPNGGEPPKLDAEQQEQFRKMSQCMRDNGVPDFPDPEPDGGIRIESKPGSRLNPEDPTFRAAQEKCEQFMPMRPGGPDGPMTDKVEG
ncbi:hypothetical protein [Alloactinosynnema sp. L-07]|uniref:hypothetical protein n=1 Tax=Alloactinosynnema sp. L-07 TaxID=1653480 RepID=UPI00065EF7B8|nr:hypothetical protein [Alloactinosynnema sp. L-07]CRK57181.1 hypothetical protein [Alloactinosynnema sp. L-07]